MTTEPDIKQRILELEEKQAREWDALKIQFKATYESLQPLNLIKSTIHDLAQAPEVQNDLLNAGISISAGYIAKKIAVGNSDSVFKNLLGDLLQLGVTATIAKHPEEIKLLIDKLVSVISGNLQPVATDDAEDTTRTRLMKEIMQLTQLIQNAEPAVHKILEETPFPKPDEGDKISTKALQDYRDLLKLKLVQFNSGPAE